MMPGDVKAAREVAEEQIRHWKYWDVTSREASIALGYTTHRRGWTRVRKALVRWWLNNAALRDDATFMGGVSAHDAL